MADTTPEIGTRKSRKTGEPVRPQRATLDAYFDTFSMWSVSQQELALEVLTQLHRQTKRLIGNEILSAQPALIEDTRG